MRRETSDVHFLVAAGLTGVFAAFALAVPARAGTPVFISDGEFADSEWAASVNATNGSTQTAEQKSSGGTPGAFRYMVHTMKPSSDIYVEHTYLGATYDPSVQGAVAALTISADMIEFEPPFTGAAVAHWFTVTQEGRTHYAYSSNVYTNTTWEGFRLACLKPANFAPVDGKLPDFSAGGKPLSFGFRRGNSNSSVAVTFPVKHGIDNFRVLVFSDPADDCNVEPSTIELEKSDDGFQWEGAPSRRITYTITAKNLAGAASAVQLHERVPVNGVFEPDVSTAGWSCSPGPEEGGRCSLTTAAIAAGESTAVTFAVRVKDEAHPLWSVFNEAEALPENPAPSEPPAVQADATEPSICSLLTPLGARICGIYCSMFPASCPAPPVPPLFTTGMAEAEDFDRFLLYRVRDRVFHETRGGQRATDLFYDHAVDLGLAVLEDPRVLDLGRANVRAWEAHLRALVAGSGASALVTQAQIDGLNAFLDALRAAANDDLRRTMDRERPRLALDTWVGISMNEALRRLDGVTCEGYEDVLFCGEVSGDCRITATDALAALRMAVETLPPNLALDMNGDGNIVASDALTILRIAVSILEPTTACNGEAG